MITRYKFVLLIALLSSLRMSWNVFAIPYPKAQVTAKITDEKGTPLMGAKVHISFMIDKKSEWGLDTIRKDGIADENGLFTTEEEGGPLVTVSARKDGFYSGTSGYDFAQRSSDNRWQPWNPTVTIVLKKKRNPAAMYAQYTGIMKIPALKTPMGYDLEKGDWVIPHGHGTTSDFVFTFQTDYRSYHDYDCSFDLTFSNPNDGIQEYAFDPNNTSYYKWPFQAPVGGYIHSISRQKSSTEQGENSSNQKDDAKYIFRIRTTIDSEGRIVSAKYGKISREFGFDPEGNIVFSYYFNPDGTRNLEFDPKRNLFQWSPEEESKHRLREP